MHINVLFTINYSVIMQQSQVVDARFILRRIYIIVIEKNATIK